MSRVANALFFPVRASAMALAAVGGGTVATIDGVRRLSGLMFARASQALTALLPRTRFDYAREVDAAKNSIVVSTIGWIARNFPDAPVRITKTVGDDVEQIRPGRTGAGAVLRLLERPNERYGGPVMWNAVIWDYKLDGNAYIWKERVGARTGDRGRVVRLWWLPQWMVEPKSPYDDTSVFISYYEYRVDGGIWAIPPEDIIHLRNGLDPQNTRKGRSPMASLFREIFTDDEASNLSAALVRNFGVPGLIVAPANTTTGPARMDVKKVQQDLVDKFGNDGNGQPMALSSPTEVRVLSWNPQQMDLKGLRRVPEERITGVLGVPAIVAGMGAGLERSTFSNFGEARAAAYTEGVIPDQRQIAAEIEIQLLVDFADLDDGYDVSFDAMKAAAMQAIAEGIWTRHESAASKGLLMRSAFLQAVGKPVAKDGSDDVYVIPTKTTFVPAGQKTPPPSALVLPDQRPPKASANELVGATT